MVDQPSNEKWQVRMVRPGMPGLDRLQDLGLPEIPWLKRPIRPADIGGVLRDVMLARENMLEDVNYKKVVPNRFIIEVSEGNYSIQFRPIETQIIQQWRELLLEELVTANSRQGRKEFRFGGRLRMEVRPARDLRENEARILSRVEPDTSRSGGGPGGQGLIGQKVEPPEVAPPQARPRVAAPIHPQHPVPPQTRPKPPEVPLAAQQPPAAGRGGFLEMVPTGQRWALYPGMNTIGRSESCQIFLDIPAIQEKRLVSGQHAYIVMQEGIFTLHDGSPDGRPSANGTYVNLRRVPPAGYHLQNGDAIVLAAVDPLYPRSDTPGVATFYFWIDRGE
jgi:hypothetical protein